LKKNLNIQAMQLAAQFFVGKKNFQNFCKMDIVNVLNYEREIFSAEIKLFKNDEFEFKNDSYNNNNINHSNNDNNNNINNNNNNNDNINNNNNNYNNYKNNIDNDENKVFFFEVEGVAFLWHMVRCMMAILFLIGF
jgi:tRNA U38,U39,U40 pseudouridine synthase TruA